MIILSLSSVYLMAAAHGKMSPSDAQGMITMFTMSGGKSLLGDKLNDLNKCPKGTKRITYTTCDICVDATTFKQLPNDNVNKYREKKSSATAERKQIIHSNLTHNKYVGIKMNETFSDTVKEFEKNKIRNFNAQYPLSGNPVFVFKISKYTGILGYNGTIFSSKPVDVDLPSSPFGAMMNEALNEGTKTSSDILVNQIALHSNTDQRNDYNKLIKKFNKKYKLELDTPEYKVYTNKGDVIILELGCHSIPQINEPKHSMCWYTRDSTKELNIIYQFGDFIKKRNAKARKKADVRKKASEKAEAEDDLL